jgi:NHLM bacteriocin system ABC transporter ATP-binding protein
VSASGLELEPRAVPGADPDAAALAGAFAAGDETTYDATSPFALDGWERAGLVEHGALNVFLQPGTLGDPSGRRRFLLRAEPGALVLGIAPSDVPDGHTVVAVAEPDTRVRELALDALVPSGNGATNGAPRVPAAALRGWVRRLATTLDADAEVGRPVIAGPGSHELEDGAVARPAADGLALAVESGALVLLGPDRAELAVIDAATAIPIAADMRLLARGATRVAVSDPLAEGPTTAAREALDRAHRLALAAAQGRIGYLEQRTNARLADERALGVEQLTHSATRIASALGRIPAPPPRVREDDFGLLLRACRRIGTHLRVEFVDPPASYRLGADPVAAIAMAAGVRHRRVALERGWERRASSPVLAFRGGERAPVALVPRPGGGFELYDPATGVESRLDAELLAALDPVAFEFYAPLPARPLGLGDLLRIGFHRQRRALVVLAVAGVLGGILALALPIATQWLFNAFIPDSDRPAIWWTAAFLLAAVISGGFLAYARSIAVVRLSGNLDGVLQAGVWDRLLALPTTFHAGFSTGDLVSRAYGINSINTILSNATVSAVLSTVFGVFSLALLFVYSPLLALFALAGLVAISGLLAWLSVRQVRHQRTMFLEKGHIFGRLFGLLQGIDKIRIAGREIPAFAEWADRFQRQQDANYRSQRVYCWLATVIAGTPLVLSMLLFAVVAGVMHADMSIGTFVAFGAALAQFTTAATQLSFALVASITVIPLYERLKQVLQAVPERNDPAGDPGLLTGRIRLENVFFRYGPQAEPTLRGVTLDVHPGESVALLGPSGAGKSTVMRMLLGFETPERGSVAYDDRNLGSLNMRMVRRQVGVVLQNSKPMPGTLLSNIIGNSALTEEDAWWAAESAGLAGDVHRMPMGMHTIVGENGVAFSGGQVQRLMIARAIVHRPRILFFDEATSALDNETQEDVMAAIEHLDATRIVIAHRLSTIRDADRLYVIDGGRVVQHGTYDSLIDEPGLFADLVRRQTV